MHRGTERLRQVQRRRRARVGDGGAGRQVAAWRQDGGRHLRRYLRPAAPGSRRGAADHRQRRRGAPDRVRRGDDQPHDVPVRRLRVRHQRLGLPAAGRPGAAQRLRHRPRDARDRRAGTARHHPARDAGGPARVHRGGRGRPQAPQAQGEGAPQARRHRRQPDPPERPADRDPAPAQAAGPSGRGGPPGGDRPGRRPRRPGPRDGRRPGHGAYGARAGAGRRDASWSSGARRSRRCWRRPGSGRAPWRRPCARTCPPCPEPRTPGSRCPACASGCAAPSHSPRSGCATPPRPRANGRSPVATPSSSRRRPPRSGSRSGRSRRRPRATAPPWRRP